MHDDTAAVRRRLCLRAALLAAIIGLASCAQYQITIPDSDPIQLEGQDGPYVSKTMHAYFWGNIMDPQVLAAACQGQGINDVFVDRNFAYDLASVLTLGVWSPLDLRFRCKAPPPRSGAFPDPATTR